MTVFAAPPFKEIETMTTRPYRDLEQELDLIHAEQERLQRALQAALRRPPSPRELRRAWLAWSADNTSEED